jgi:hypothetical protein
MVAHAAEHSIRDVVDRVGRASVSVRKSEPQSIAG